MNFTSAQQNSIAQILRYLAEHRPGFFTVEDAENLEVLYLIAADEIINLGLVNVLEFRLEEYGKVCAGIAKLLTDWTPPNYWPLWGLMQQLTELTATEDGTKQFFVKAQELARKGAITISTDKPLQANVIRMQ